VRDVPLAGHPHVPCNFLEPFCLSNFKESLNGFLFGNLPMLTMRQCSVCLTDVCSLLAYMNHRNSPIRFTLEN